MRYVIEISDAADEDLRGIFEYIALTLQSLQSAIGQLNRLEESIMRLDEMSERFRPYEKEPWRSRGMHIMPADNYLVFYIVDKEAEKVTVIRVMYGGRDVETQLGES